MTVYLLWHTSMASGDEDHKLLGVYSTHMQADAAHKRALRRPGFADEAEGFDIDEYELDRDEWVDGFVVTLD